MCTRQLRAANRSSVTEMIYQSRITSVFFVRGERSGQTSSAYLYYWLRNISTVHAWSSKDAYTWLNNSGFVQTQNAGIMTTTMSLNVITATHHKKSSRLLCKFMISVLLLHISSFIPETSGSSSYCLPSDSCWPSPQDWAAFNDTVNGQVIVVVPELAVCFRQGRNSSACIVGALFLATCSQSLLLKECLYNDRILADCGSYGL